MMLSKLSIALIILALVLFAITFSTSVFLWYLYKRRRRSHQLQPVPCISNCRDRDVCICTTQRSGSVAEVTDVEYYADEGAVFSQQQSEINEPVLSVALRSSTRHNTRDQYHIDGNIRTRTPTPLVPATRPTQVFPVSKAPISAEFFEKDEITNQLPKTNKEINNDKNCRSKKHTRQKLAGVTPKFLLKDDNSSTFPTACSGDRRSPFDTKVEAAPSTPTVRIDLKSTDVVEDGSKNHTTFTPLHFNDFSQFSDFIRNSSLPVLETSAPTEIGEKESAVPDNKADKALQEYVESIRQQYNVSTSLSGESGPFRSQEERSLHNKIVFILGRVEQGYGCNEDMLTLYGKCLKLVRSFHNTLFRGEELALPDSLSQMELYHGISYLQELQIDRKVDKSIPLAQKLILLDKRQQNWTVTPLGFQFNFECNLIIGVDATPSHTGGYCVNLVDKRIEYYIMKSRDLPWEIKQRKCADEFEMKNFLFALTVWHADIERLKTLSVFTDNVAIVNSQRSNENTKKQGGKARSLLDHFGTCKKIRINRSSMFVNRTKDLVLFAKFIQPADDLSRLQVGLFYDIDQENVKGTHLSQESKNRGSKLTETPFYKEQINTAQMFIHSFHCRDCDCIADLTASIRGKQNRLEILEKPSSEVKATPSTPKLEVTTIELEKQSSVIMAEIRRPKKYRRKRVASKGKT